MNDAPSSASTAAAAVSESVYVTKPIPEFRPGDRPAMRKCARVGEKTRHRGLGYWLRVRTWHKLDPHYISLGREQILNLLGRCHEGKVAHKELFVGPRRNLLHSHAHT